MIQRDYVLRLIAEAARFVALALGVRQRGDAAEARALLDHASRALTAQPLAVVEALDDAALRSLCHRGEAFVPELAVALADVLHAAGHAGRARPLYDAARRAGAAVPWHGL